MKTMEGEVDERDETHGQHVKHDEGARNESEEHGKVRVTDVNQPYEGNEMTVSKARGAVMHGPARENAHGFD